MENPLIEYDRNLEYCTNDLYFAAFLLCVGCRKTRVIKKKTIFYFLFDNQVNTVKQLQKDYFNHDAKVSPLKYKSCLKDLRDEMNLIGR